MKWHVFAFLRCSKVMCIENTLIRLNWSHAWRSTSTGVWSIVSWWLYRIHPCIWNTPRKDRRSTPLYSSRSDRRVRWYRCVCGPVSAYTRTVRLFVRDMYYLNKSNTCTIVTKLYFMILKHISGCSINVLISKSIKCTIVTI